MQQAQVIQNVFSGCSSSVSIGNGSGQRH